MFSHFGANFEAFKHFFPCPVALNTNTNFRSAMSYFFVISSIDLSLVRYPFSFYVLSFLFEGLHVIGTAVRIRNFACEGTMS